jgi:hypothetical protein
VANKLSALIVLILAQPLIIKPLKIDFNSSSENGRGFVGTLCVEQVETEGGDMEVIEPCDFRR